MSCLTQTFLLCDGCRNQSIGINNPGFTKQQQRAEAKNEGWTTISQKQLDALRWDMPGKGIRDLCYDCSFGVKDLIKQGQPKT